MADAPDNPKYGGTDRNRTVRCGAEKSRTLRPLRGRTERAPEQVNQNRSTAPGVRAGSAREEPFQNRLDGGLALPSGSFPS